MSLSEKISNCSKIFSDEYKEIIDPKGQSNSKYKIDNKNNKEFKIIQIDRCVFDARIDKCDFGLEVENTIHFIELKGKDIDTAVAQLESSLQNIKVSGKKYAFVVSSRNDHPNAKTQQQKFVKKFKLKYQCSFDIKNGLMGKTIEELKY